MSKVVDIRLGSQSFPYYFFDTCQPFWLDIIASLYPDKIFVICDSTVASIYGAHLVRKLLTIAPTHSVIHPVGELAKNLTTAEHCLTRVVSEGASRQSIIVALGGGVTGNIAGLVAGLCFRGIRLVHVPTTLMALLDSVISLKQGVNSKFGKNHFGCFLRPECVIADTKFLSTLPPEHLRSGACEVIKNTLAIDPEFAGELMALLNPSSKYNEEDLEKLISRGVELKLQILQDDQYEKHSGVVFEYGHTVGHAIEHCLAGSITHGDCVALGMMVAANIAQSLLDLPQHAVELHHNLVDSAGAPKRLPLPLKLTEIMARILRDNKRGYLRAGQDEAVMVLLSSLGRPAESEGYPLVRVPISVVQQGLCTIGAR